MAVMKNTVLFSCFMLAVKAGAFMVQPKHLSTSRRPVFLQRTGTRSTTPPKVSAATCMIRDSLAQTLKKASKTLSVTLEYSGPATPPTSSKKGSKSDLENLSMLLRKVNASALVTRDLEVAKVLVREQATAQGNFPGPCPVLYSGSLEDVPAVMQAGVTAVIVNDNDNNAMTAVVSSLDRKKIDIIVQVNSPESVNQAAYVTNAFLVNGHADNLDEILDAIMAISTSSSSINKPIVLASLEAMQDGNAEIQKAKALQGRGIVGILVQNAAVGDAEDLDYATFVIVGLTTKRSSSFNMSGLTGSANGHFDGVATSLAKTWQRIERQKQQQ